MYMIGLLFMTVSCNSINEDLPGQYGELSVALGQPDVEVVTKAATLSKDDPAAAGYMISIYSEGDALQYGPVSYTSFESQILAFGNYYVTAENCTEEQAQAGNGKMRLHGKSENVTLSLENIFQTATVNCTVSNALVTVAFSSDLYNGDVCRFDDLKVVLTNDATTVREVTVNASKSDTEVWFNPCNLHYVISGSYNGKSVSAEGDLELSAKSNFKIAVNVNKDKGEIFVPEVTFGTVTENTNENPFNPYV